MAAPMQLSEAQDLPVLFDTLPYARPKLPVPGGRRPLRDEWQWRAGLLPRPARRMTLREPDQGWLYRSRADNVVRATLRKRDEGARIDWLTPHDVRHTATRDSRLADAG